MSKLLAFVTGISMLALAGAASAGGTSEGELQDVKHLHRDEVIPTSQANPTNVIRRRFDIQDEPAAKLRIASSSGVYA